MTNDQQHQATDLTLTSTAKGAENFLRWSKSAMLRGGRVTKFKGVAASYSPELGLVTTEASAEAVGGRGSSTLSLARRLLQWSAAPLALAAATSPAFAQAQDECVEINPGEFVCEDNGAAAAGTPNFSPATRGDDVTITLQDGFDLERSTGSGDGINVTNAGDVVIAQESGSSTIAVLGDAITVASALGSIDITIGGDVSSGIQDGIRVSNSTLDRTDIGISIDSRAGTVTGYVSGFAVSNSGDMGLSITTADVEGERRYGIYARSTASDVLVDTTAGSVTGGTDGINVSNSGDNASITTADVTGTGENGINAINEAGSGDLAIDSSAGVVTGRNTGIFARNSGSGETTITTADVDGEDGDGINVESNAGTGNVVIDTTAGTVFGRYSGIRTLNDGDGATTIITSDVYTGAGEGGTRDGINAVNGTSATDLIIDTSAGSVRSLTRNGIVARNNGTGETTITTASVEGRNGDGVDIYNGADGADLTINSTAGVVTGAQDGIEATNFGTGDLSITTGDVDGEDGVGIAATNQGVNTGDLTIDSSAGAVSGEDYGIEAENRGTGNTTIITGDVTSATNAGIAAVNINSAVNLTIDSSAGSIVADQDGVDVRNFGTGATSVTVGNVTGFNAGIRARNNATATDLTINSTAGTVYGDFDAIIAINDGTGATLITTSDIHSNSGGDGVSVDHSGTDVTVDTSAGIITSTGLNSNGVNVRNDGTGNTAITTADVTGETRHGITVENASTAGDLVVDTSGGAVTGFLDAISARNNGTGATTIITGDVTNTGTDTYYYYGTFTDYLTALDVSTSDTSSSLTIDTTGGTLIGTGRGLDVDHDGSGSLTITTGAVVGDAEAGIRIVSEGTDLVLDTTAGDVRGAQQGIDLDHRGTGSTTVVTGNVTGGTSYYQYGGTYSTNDAIRISNGSSSQDLALDTTQGVISGDRSGINTRNSGAGDTTITTADVRGGDANGISAENRTGTGNLTIDTTAGAVEGLSSGIFVQQDGSGDTTITTGDVTGTSARGIFATNEAGSGDLAIDSTAGAVTGQFNGIFTRNYSENDTAITTSDVTSTDGEGIRAISSVEQGGDLTIDSTEGTVLGQSTGILASNFGAGSLSVRTADVTGQSRNGIFATNESGSGDALIVDTSAGAVSGAFNGIFVSNNGVGETTITTADVTAGSNYGIRALNGSTATDLIVDSSAGSVTTNSSAQAGIRVINSGTGITRVVAADVSASAGNGENGNYGIQVFSGLATTGAEVDTVQGAIVGDRNGIFFQHLGSGISSVVTGDVTGLGGNGIVIIEQNEYNQGGAGSINIDTTAGVVTGGVDGIYALNVVTGDLAITTGDVTGTTGNGISAANGAGTGNLTINSSAGAVSGGINAIRATNSGTGNTSITTADTSTYGNDEAAIFATNAASAGDLIIDASAGRTFSGAGGGIEARNNGTGVLSITTADVTSTGEGFAGVDALGLGTDLIVDTTDGALVADGVGIQIINNGAGFTSVTTADVDGESGEGIFVNTASSTTDLTIDSSAGAVSGSFYGVYAKHYGSGALMIVTGDVTGEGFGARGIGAEVGSSATGLTIDSSAGAVVGGEFGIQARNYGTGNTSITTANVTGAEEGEGGFAIDAQNGATAGDLLIDTTAGSLESEGFGLRAVNAGTGLTTITTADVTSDVADAITVTNEASAGDLTINTSAGAVFGGYSGILARNNGTGDTTITTADVDGESGDGIYARHDGLAADIIIDSSGGEVSGRSDGIEALNYGSGAVSITSADVTGVFAIFALGYGTDVTVDSSAGSLNGRNFGVTATNAGSGATSVTTADVTSGVASAVAVTNTETATDLMVDTSAGDVVTDSSFALRVSNRGTGTTNVVTANVSSRAGTGVEVRVGSTSQANSNAGDVVIDTSAGEVRGRTSGLVAINNGRGNLLITTSNVTADLTNGIFARNSQTAGDIVINTSAGSVTGSDRGIRAINDGTGDTSITTGDVTGADAAGDGEYGIFAENGFSAGDLTIDSSAGSVTGDQSGIIAENTGTGSTTIITADVTGLGASDNGIDFENAATTAGLLIDTTRGTVTGGDNAISVSNAGNGLVTITTADVTGIDGKGIELGNLAGDVVIDSRAGTVRGEYGVFVQNEAAGSLSISTGDVIGEEFGIYAYNSAADATDIILDTSAGSVTAEEVGIFIENEGTGQTVITTADVTADTGDGIDATTLGADLIIDTSAGTVTGASTGIDADNSSTGDTLVTTADVTGAAEAGITVEHSATAGNIQIDTTAGTVTGETVGVIARQYGTGATQITTANVVSPGDDTGSRGFGIYVATRADSQEVAIDSSAGAITSYAAGIFARHDGAGALSVTSGDIDSASSDGISLITSAAEVLVDATAGAINAGIGGIRVTNNGSLSTSVTTANVTAEGGDGIEVINGASATDLTIDSTAGTVTGAQRGIIAQQNGSGAVTITTGDVTGTAEQSFGVAAYSVAGSGVTIDTTAGVVSGGALGVGALNQNPDAGLLTITTGDVSATYISATANTGGVAVFGINYGQGMVVDTSAGDASGTRAGIIAQNLNGSLSITTANVEATDGTGIVVNNQGTDLTIDTSAGTVTGAANAIAIDNQGTGATSITTANVMALAGDGVNIATTADATTLDIDTSAGAVVGSNHGIFADHQGTGDLTITVGNVTGQGAEGILASTTQASANILVQGGDGVESNVIGATDGIALSTQGADITVTGLDSVTGQAGDGLNLVSNGGDIAVTDIGTVTGLGGNGIFASSDAGNISVQNVGLVGGITATGGVGIAAYADNGGTISIGTSGDIGEVSGDTYGAYGSAAGGTGDVTINSSNYSVTGAIGISAANAGAGDVSVTTADVTGTGGAGIIASANGGTVLVDTVVGTVSGLTYGITASNTGTGDITITTANVTGATGDGISADTIGDIIIDSAAGSVTGGQNGIIAVSRSGAFNITAANVTGQSGDGINARSTDAGGDTVINTVAGTVTGSEAGIDLVHANLGSNASIITADVNGDANGILAEVSGGDLLINATAGSVAGGTDGINAALNSEDLLTIITGNVAGGENGIFARSQGIDLVINSAAGAVSGGTNGIDAQHDGTGTVTIITGDVTGTAGNGINAAAAASGADLVINTTAGTVTGGQNGISGSNQGTGSTTITTADVTGLGETDNGIDFDNAATTTGLFIDTTLGTVTGGDNAISLGNAGAGPVTITTADVTGNNGKGIELENLAGDVVIDSTAGTVRGEYGVFVQNEAAGSLSITTGDVIGEAYGIYAYNEAADATDITVDTSAGSVTADGVGIFIENEGIGQTAITTADVTTDTDDGIDATTFGADLIINSVAGTVTGGEAGINADNAGDGELVLTTADVTGLAGYGIEVGNRATATDLTINSSAGVVNGGIDADNNGSGATSIIAGDVTGAVNGISAVNAASSTDLAVHIAAGTVTGGTDGINAENAGSGELALTTADVIGTDGAGIAANNAGTNLALDSSAGTVSGGTDGITAENTGTGQLSIVSGDVAGAAGDGIDATNLGTDLIIDTAAGTVSGAVNGLNAAHSGLGSASVTTANVTGTVAAGVLVSSAGGDIAIDTNSGIVQGTTIGVQAQQEGAGTIDILVNEVTGAVGIDTNATTGATVITLGSTAVVTGTSGFGIDARSTGGNITVQGSSGSVTGATDGIYVRPTTGDITITNIDLVEGLAADGLDLLTVGGNISVSDIDTIIGGGGNGITASAADGAVDVQSAGDITGALAGVAAATTGAGMISLDLGGATTGTQNGLDVSTEGGAVAISNSGSLSGGDFAVLASGPSTGPITLSNAGTLSSAVQFAAADDSFTNSGTFTAEGVSDFGEGTDTFVNSNLLAIASSADFQRLEQLQSSGLIDLADGAVGGLFTTSGDFIGDSGQVGLDINFATAESDLLVIGGAATGSTDLVLNVIAGGFSFDEALRIVDAGAGTEASAFSISEDAQSAAGFLAFELNFDAATNDFFVNTNLDERVFESTKIAEAAQSLWYRSADAWADNRASSRGAGADANPVWVVAYGVTYERDEQFGDPTGLGLEDANLDYEQDYFGLQTGVNYQIGQSLSFGVTGGYLSSNFRQSASGTRAQFDVLNIGLSASLNTGGFFADALVKYDSISGNLTDSAQGGFAGELDGSAFGARIDAGYRIGSDTFYVEPRVSLDLQKTDLDSLDIAGQTFDFDNLNGLRGAAGLRLGGYGKTLGVTRIGYFLDASAVREFDGEADIRFQAGNVLVDFQNDAIGTYGHLEAGITLDSEGPLSGFFQVESDLASDYSSFGAKVGVKVKF